MASFGHLCKTVIIARHGRCVTSCESGRVLCCAEGAAAGGRGAGAGGAAARVRRGRARRSGHDLHRKACH